MIVKQQIKFPFFYFYKDEKIGKKLEIELLNKVRKYNVHVCVNHAWKSYSIIGDSFCVYNYKHVDINTHTQLG